MQNGALFRDIDPLVAKHRLDTLAQPGLFRQFKEQADCLSRDVVL
jgi:hypothetical protein